MRVDDLEMFLLLEAAMQDRLPLPEGLSVVGLHDHVPRLGQLAVGDRLGWRDAWAVMTRPELPNPWRAVPLRGGNVVLGHIGVLAPRHLVDAESWAAGAAGVLAALATVPASATE